MMVPFEPVLPKCGQQLLVRAKLVTAFPYLLAPHKNIRHQPTSPTTRHFIASIECDDENQPTKTIGVLV